MIAAVSTLFYVVRHYRARDAEVRRTYTDAVKKHDIVDNARNTIAAIEDAEVQMQDYVLTGETVYREAYRTDVRSYEDESGALRDVGVNDSTTVYTGELADAGKRTMDELALMESVYEKSGREAALERIRKGSASVYLNQTTGSLLKIQQNGSPVQLDNEVVTVALSTERRLVEGAVALFMSTFAALILLAIEMRSRSREA